MAPKDFCRPMIGTLSLTDTNIILAIPKPPTKIEKLPIIQPATVNTSKTPPIILDKYSGLFIAKFSSSKGFIPLWALSKPVSSYSSSTNPGSISAFPLTIIYLFGASNCR